MAENPWLDERELRAWRSLQLMHLRLDGALSRQLARESSLSYPDYLVLAALSDEEDRRLRLRELAAVLGWEKSRLSHQVNRMAARGLVAKAPADEDRRGTYVAMTATGRTAIEQAAPGNVALVRRLFVEPLTARQLDGIAKAAEAVLAAIAEAEAEAEVETADG